MLGGAAWGQDDAAQGSDKIITAHGYSFYGDLKYPADYTHFDYVNPDAPKGGEISISTLGTFDSMNPYSRKGRGGALSTVMYESLLGEGVGGEIVPCCARALNPPRARIGWCSTCIRTPNSRPAIR